MIYEQKNFTETSFINNKVYEKPDLTNKKGENKKNQSDPTLSTNKKSSSIQRSNKSINKKEIKSKKKIEDSNDKLLNIEHVNEIFKKNNPKFLENFEFLESIKAGSAGAVLRAKLKNSKDKNVACKVIPVSKTEKNIYKRHREAFIHKTLHHKNIPELHGFYPVGENYSCMVMELNKYGDIDSFKKNVIKRSCLSESLISYFSGNILEALLYLAKKNIIHMDIKQQNIVIDDFLNVKITDYSVSLKYNEKEEFIELPMVGTCYYMSPEVLGRRRILVSEASKIDIYSFGVLLYRLAFNDYPYELNDVDSSDYRGIYENITKKNLEFPKDSGHSEMFKNFLRKCLEKDIKKRYNIYQAINDPWMKGFQLILNEKENLYHAGKFVVELMVDNIKEFNDYVKTG